MLGLALAIDSFGQLINGDDLRKQLYYDSTLNGMIIRDPKSVERALGTTVNVIDSKDERD